MIVKKLTCKGAGKVGEVDMLKVSLREADVNGYEPREAWDCFGNSSNKVIPIKTCGMYCGSKGRPLLFRITANTVIGLVSLRNSASALFQHTGSVFPQSDFEALIGPLLEELCYNKVRR